MTERGYYSLIQFCPDLSRLESVNIGVVLYIPSKYLKARVSRDNSRIRQVFGKQHWDLVSRAKSAIESKFQHQQFGSIRDLELFIAKRANAIQLTAARPVKILRAPDEELENLFLRLVGAEKPPRTRRIEAQLRTKFEQAGVENLVQRSISVELPVLNQPIRVPYGYQNGRFNLIEPVQFDRYPEDLLTKAGKRAIEGQLLYQHADPNLGELRLVVVAKFPDEADRSSRELVNEIFKQHRVGLHTFDNLDPLLRDIEESASRHRAKERMRE